MQYESICDKLRVTEYLLKQEAASAAFLSSKATPAVDRASSSSSEEDPLAAAMAAAQLAELENLHQAIDHVSVLDIDLIFRLLIF